MPKKDRCWKKGSYIWLVSSDGRHSSGVCFSLIKLRRKTKEMYWNSAKFIYSTLTVLHKCGVTAEMTCDFGFQWTNPFHPHRAGPPPSVVARYQRHPAMFHDFPHENSQSLSGEKTCSNRPLIQYHTMSHYFPIKRQYIASVLDPPFASLHRPFHQKKMVPTNPPVPFEITPTWKITPVNKIKLIVDRNHQPT
jgi:hypothetical protein